MPLKTREKHCSNCKKSVPIMRVPGQGWTCSKCNKHYEDLSDPSPPTAPIAGLVVRRDSGNPDLPDNPSAI